MPVFRSANINESARIISYRQVSTIHFARQRIDQCQQQDRLLLSRKLPEFAKVGIVGIGELEQFVNTGTSKNRESPFFFSNGAS